MRPLRLALIALVTSTILVALALGVDPRALLDDAGVHNALGVARGFAQPDLNASTLARIAGLALESIAIGFAGTALALEAAGTKPFGLWVFSVLPIALPRLIAYALFRFEVNVRTTTMVGFVGAGGIGDALHTAISLFHVADLAALLLVLLCTVALVDAVGDRVRARLLVSPSMSGPGAAASFAG